MGGIFAVSSSSRDDVINDVITGLRRLRHRGCDCVGFAVVLGNELVIRKDRGNVDDVLKSLRIEELKSRVCLGHTRFSTHGRPHHENAHPHTDCTASVAVVGDGVIANYEDLRDELVVRGHDIKSRCDFEVVAHLIEEGLKEGLGPLKSFVKAVRRLEGIFSLATLFKEGPTLITYSKLQSLYVGTNESSTYVSSTKSALKGFTSKYFEVPEGLVTLIVDGKASFLDLRTLREVRLVSKVLEVPDELIEKDGYPHFMLKEIYEVPEVIIKASLITQRRYRELAARLVANARQVYVIANGSSLHAGMVGSYYLAELAGVSSVVLSAAEFPLYHVDNVAPGTVVLAISQSGETGDVIRAVYEAKLRGATILSITNNIDSRLAKLSSLYLPIGAGPEVSIPATKTFVATLVTLYVVALETAEYLGKLGRGEVIERLREVREVGKVVKEWLGGIDSLAKEVAEEIVRKSLSGYVISRGINYPLALEGALKLKEAAYFHAEGVEAGEFRHGPITLVDDGFLTVFIIPTESGAAEATYPLIRDAYERRAVVVAVGSEDSLRYVEEPVSKLGVPKVPKHLTPITNVVPLQLLSYHLGVLRGCPIDKPKKLVKAVT